MTTVTIAPPPASAPNATPVLRVCTISTPGNTASRSPCSTVARTSAFVAWSSATTPAATMATRPHAPTATYPWISPTTMLPTMRSRTIAMIGLRSIGPRGGMNRRKTPRYGSPTVRQEPEHRARPPRVRDPSPEREEHRAQDVGDDQDDVDVDDRRDVAGNVVAHGGDREG